jgi:putative tricarboxylic transport membrane protein
MVMRDLDVTLSIIWTLVVANAVAAIVCFGLTKQVSRISLIPAPNLVLFLLVVTVFAPYQAGRHWSDTVRREDWATVRDRGVRGRYGRAHGTR